MQHSEMRRPESFLMHREVYDAVVARDPARAADVMAGHMGTTPVLGSKPSSHSIISIAPTRMPFRRKAIESAHQPEDLKERYDVRPWFGSVCFAQDLRTEFFKGQRGRRESSPDAGHADHFTIGPMSLRLCANCELIQTHED